MPFKNSFRLKSGASTNPVLTITSSFEGITKTYCHLELGIKISVIWLLR